ncbi:hypothetical protein Gbro_0133 [Gordonia bronchialis DSM 43247]|uniref:Uncharacterized protein n=1 Tax=Gordonia bronchialis (strain ATCC 25592 / DSM 43247 / BCRC 13721 / JCM 3198 / KCTC 3076 / NBRC 16047 / NCTC 10667) TaxID=526226 RepID=D0LB50_GORB4|nr:hypothetical protein Gbro_0133 [Gordonia bronchialis DSM 43247]STQ62240.1 Uncharacterised protein [Gordonia bronchialis]
MKRWASVLIVAAALTLTVGAGSSTAAPRSEQNSATLVALTVEAQPVAVPGWPVFPAVYGPRYWPQFKVWFTHNTFLNRAQTRQLYETGWVPGYANTQLPFSSVARTLQGNNLLRTAVQRGGCFAIGTRTDPVWSPVAKKWVTAGAQGYMSPPHLKAQVDAICR